ncbi:AAEL005427-PA [Aedes aegypti]|uniref:AAEL005427-PA n=1 Tax=Aedes aegypti TaxID=7159 RepID=Q17A61_AEDAE|nr:AAEL005427-PA [Aedes aegypti]
MPPTNFLKPITFIDVDDQNGATSRSIHKTYRERKSGGTDQAENRGHATTQLTWQYTESSHKQFCG